MDEEVREPLAQTRLVGWLVAGLLVAGLVSIGTVNAQNEAEHGRVVAAGQGADGVELPTTLGDFVPSLPPTSAPPPPATVAAPTTTTAPKPTPTAPPATQPTRTTTTKPAGTATSTTTAAPSAPAGPVFSVTVNVVNEYAQAVNVTVNGKAFTLAPGQQSGPVTIARFDHGNDIVEVSPVQNPSCGMGDAGGYFPTPGSYRLAVVAGRGFCQSGVPGPSVVATPA